MINARTLPKGVHTVPSGKYRATVWDKKYRANFYIGVYDTVENAQAAQEAKQKEIDRIAKKSLINSVPLNECKNEYDIEHEETLELNTLWICRGCKQEYNAIKQPSKCSKCGSISFDWK